MRDTTQSCVYVTQFSPQKSACQYHCAFLYSLLRTTKCAALAIKTVAYGRYDVVFRKNAEHTLNRTEIMRFPERLKEAVGNDSVRGFAQKCGLSESGLRKYLSGETFPPLDKLILIAEAANRSFSWLCSGEVEQPLARKDESEFALIPGYSVQVSAGHGAINQDELKPSRYLAFRRKWLKFRGFNEGDLALVWAKGDSMEPTIHSNDTLVVHTGRIKPQDGHIYIFRDEDQLFVKRYQSIIGAWRLISDNSIYTPLDIPKSEQHNFQVVGQVVHIAKDIGD